MPTMQRNPRGGVIDPRNFGRGAGTVRSPMAVPGFQDGGQVYEDEEDIEGQGADDAMIDPMQFVQGALNYGKKKYGIPIDDGEQEMGFDDGGVVPMMATEGEDPGVTGGGNPNAVDPRQAMAYLSGDGAVSQEIAQALEQRVDPNGSLNPTERAMAAIQAAPDGEARFGMLQHYRTKYNAFTGAAKAALSRGDMGGAAHYASLAMDSVPDGKRTQFAPAQGGLAMISKPAFGQPQQPQQQSFARGGYVQSFQDGNVVEEEEDEEVLSHLQPEPQADPPDVAADAPDVTVPEQEPLTGPQDTMPVQSQDYSSPEVTTVPPQTLMQMLGKGFDELVEAQKRQMPTLFGRGSAAAVPEPEPSSGVLPTPARANVMGLRGTMMQPATPPILRSAAAEALYPNEVAAQSEQFGPQEPFGPPAPAAPEMPQGQEQRFRPAGAPAAAPAAPAGPAAPAAPAPRARPQGVVPTAASQPDYSPQRVVRGEFGANRVGALPPPRWDDTQAQRDARQNAKYRDFLASTQSADVHVPGGDNVFTSRPPDESDNPYMKRLRQAQEAAGAAFPWVGADAAKRDAFVAQAMKELEGRETKFGQEDIRGRRARDTAVATTERAHGLETQRQTGRETLLDRKAANERGKEIFRAKTKQIMQSQTEMGKTLREFTKNQPNLIGNPFEMRRLLGGHLKQMGVKTDEDIEAVSQAMLGLTGGGGVVPTGAGANGRDYADQAAARNLQPGATVKRRGDDGLIYEYVVTNRGTLRRDESVPGRAP